MLISTNLLPLLKRSICLVERWNLVPFSSPITICLDTRQLPIQSSCKSLSLKIRQPKINFQASKSYCNNQWKAHSLILTLVTLLGFYKYFFESSKLEQKVLNAWKLGFIILHLFLAWHYCKNADHLADFFNQIIRFETRHSKYIDEEETANNSKFVVTLVKNILTCIHGNAFIFAFGAALFPVTTWSVIPQGAFGLFDQSSYKVVMNLGERAISFLITFIIWRVICNLGVLAVVVNMLIATFCLQATISVFIGKASNEPDFKLSYQTYREIQLLCLHYNEFHKHSIHLGFVLTAPTTLAISLFLVISRWKTLDVPALTIFLNFVVTMTAIILLNFRYATKVFAESNAVKVTQCYGNILRFFTAIRNRSLNRRYWKALPVLKVNFFGSNYFDSKTSLVLIGIALDMTINLILVGA